MEEKDEQQCGDGALVKLYSETEQEIAPAEANSALPRRVGRSRLPLHPRTSSPHAAMALPKTLHPALTPDELAFLAEHDHISIVPLFSMTRVRLISVSPRIRTPHMLTRRRRRVYMGHSGRLQLLESRCGSACPSRRRGNAE